MSIFETFDLEGSLYLPNLQSKSFGSLPWNEHPIFQGVALKHLVTAADTQGAFSYHLVRIAPNCSIDAHIHETQSETHEVVGGNGVCVMNGCEVQYTTGTIAIIPAKLKHSVHANNDGLLLFAKFMPAL